MQARVPPPLNSTPEADLNPRPCHHPAPLLLPPAPTVSSKFIDEFKMACSEEDRSQLKLMMGHVHVYVTAACKEYFDKFRRHVYVTPKSYLSFIQGYKELYSRKWAYTQELAASIQVGLVLPSPLTCLVTPSFLQLIYKASYWLSGQHTLKCTAHSGPDLKLPGCGICNRLACKKWLRPRRT